LAHGFRSELDEEASTIGYKIRAAELQKIPYMAIVGKHEAETGKIAVRKHGAGNVGLLTTGELVKRIKQENHE
jgi:threonyl-tRNA synthetase